MLVIYDSIPIQQNYRYYLPTYDKNLKRRITKKYSKLIDEANDIHDLLSQTKPILTFALQIGPTAKNHFKILLIIVTKRKAMKGT